MRGTKFDKSGIKKGVWSAEEDQKLIAFINRFGILNWSLIPKYADLPRTGKSCRLRWVNYLCPTIKRGNITKEEEDIIISLHQTLGNKWSAIASKLPGRTDNEIKNYWHGHLKKHFMENTKMTVNALKLSNLEGSCVPISPYASTQCSPSSCITGLTFESDEEQKMEDLEMHNISIEENGNLDQFFWEELYRNSCMIDEMSAMMELQVSQECWYQEPLISPYDYNMWDSIFLGTIIQADNMNGEKEPNSDFC